MSTSNFRTKIFADGADKQTILKRNEDAAISGFTTNPTLMRKSGIADYKAFALDILKVVKDKPISFEVFSDDFEEMAAQALEIASWADNVYVKVPITNTKRESSVPLIEKLAVRGVKLNVTAIMTLHQVASVLPAMSKAPAGFISVFAGRIADAGVDPLPIMEAALSMLAEHPQLELIWASPRELYNLVQANNIGCHVITVTDDILKKLPTIGKDLEDFSLETVKMFYDDAASAGFSIPLATFQHLPVA